MVFKDRDRGTSFIKKANNDNKCYNCHKFGYFK